MDVRNVASLGDKSAQDNPLPSLAEMDVSTAHKSQHADGTVDKGSLEGSKQETELLDMETAIARGLISADFWMEQPTGQE